MVSFPALVGLHTTLSLRSFSVPTSPLPAAQVQEPVRREGGQRSHLPPLSGLALDPCSKQGEGIGGYKWPGQPVGACGCPPTQAKLHIAVCGTIFKKTTYIEKRLILCVSTEFIYEYVLYLIYNF